jgi:ketosteroid isomerase-like protein
MRIPSVLALAVLAAAGGARAVPDPLRQPPTAAGVMATEAAWVRALQTRDIETLGRLLADDFVDTTWKGARRTKPEMIESLTANGPQPLDLSDLSVSLHGGTAVARGLNTIHGRDGGVRAHIRFTDVFLYSKGAWRALSAQETLEGP